ncbi:hypothetical protein A3I57_02110 [Candidatus Beckwithbacteria bacterium RIFCSPLOWO2_02_FULL_47_23]|uniref:DUF2130 domain-containing protein n=1 Tax=Candidatus Beckwithbacteria bacterium RIFCSPLOWO2_02_FULL_47_23 TaxID=1797463 RepID=A0A1F5DQH6_9BACT|nr:MAG: hypothetical protein A3I57_02110 [Candidatus Beckwithbacteria bacterium RIFCSPLOWO2_02_FULL_47_23]
MLTTIKCKYCGKELEISEALQHEIQEEAVKGARKEAQAEALVKLKALEKEKDEEKERNGKLLKQLEDLTDEVRSLRRKDEERELEMKKRLSQEEGKIKEELAKKFADEHELKDQEKNKVINDLKKALEAAQRKAEQGSQQTQGEVLELELEALLKKEFPDDGISEVKKGQRGADVIQTVIDKNGQACGLILWESKNAQWHEGWLKKLREDQRAAKAHLAVLVATDHPKNYGLSKYINNVWVVDRKAILILATALRFDLIHVNHERLMNVGKNEKMEVLYQYITGNEFTHRIEAIVESFTNLQSDIEREKRWFSIKWARQEKEIRKVIDSTHGIYGELQAVSGRALQTIKQLEGPES